MTTEMRTLSVRLEPDEHEAVKEIAREHELSLMGLVTELVKQYAAGPMPPPPRPRPTPVSEMMQTKVQLPANLIEKAKKRASREHVVLSDEIYRMALRLRTEVPAP